MAKESLFDKVDTKTRRWAKLITAITVLLGAAAGLCSWVSQQFAQAVSSQISEFQQEMTSANNRHEQTITRVELIALIEHDPDNTTAIEKIARYYFKDLNGDLYMTKKYSDWAKENGGDLTIVIGDK